MGNHSEGPVFASMVLGFAIGAVLCVLAIFSVEKEREDTCAKEHNIYQCEGQRIYVPVQEVE